MSSSDYFNAFTELKLTSTLGLVTATNPLNTTESQQNNVEDVNNQLRNSMIKNVNSLTPFAISTTLNPLSINVSNSFLCWLRANNTEMNDLMNAWAEDMKYGLSNVSLLSDTDPTTNSKYMLFLEYVRLNVRRYFIRTREHFLMDHYLPKCEQSVVDVYFKFRKYYYDMVYKQLYSSYYPVIFTNLNQNGWTDVAGILQNFVLTPFRALTTTNTTYGNFLNNYTTLCQNLFFFLQSSGPLGQFIT